MMRAAGRLAPGLRGAVVPPVAARERAAVFDEGVDTPPADARVRSAADVIKIAVAAYGILVLVSVAGGTVLAALDDGWLGRADLRVSEWFERNRTATWDDATAIVTRLANTETVIAIALVATVLLVRPLQRATAARFLVVGLVLEVTVFLTCTVLVGRDRPDVVRLDDAPPTSSFFSGHTAAAVVLYGGLALLAAWSCRPRLARVLWLLGGAIVLSVALSRLYRGMHHVTDVVYGAGIGAACIVAALIAVGMLRVEAPTSPRQRRELLR